MTLVVRHMNRVSRGLSLCTTSFLSMFQAVIIMPSNSRWAWLKPKIPTCIFPAFLLFWIINMLIYIWLIIVIVASHNTTEVVQKYSLKYCSGKNSDRHHRDAFLVSIVIQEVLCMFFIIWTSVYVVRLFFTHRRTVQHIHRTSLCPRASPEAKATHTILALVSCFVFFYWTNNCLTIYVSYRRDVQGLENIAVFLSYGYPAICPFVLIKNSNRQSLLKCAFAKMNKSSKQTISPKGLTSSHTSLTQRPWIRISYPIMIGR
ncbi:vomeronasal type-1 receptor 4-like [Manis javanica]|uniref:vomeronasal type-1 receptor 4-like n=1 Tax=Manis javanica TaxID=9974 RepID=UPI003C6D960E